MCSKEFKHTKYARKIALQAEHHRRVLEPLDAPRRRYMVNDQAVGVSDVFGLEEVNS